MRTKKLRVGYVANTPPFSFKNHDHHLVGYDIAFAYELAYDLGCELELIPMSYSTLIRDLKNDTFDIAMSAVSISEDRLIYLSFTQPYMKPRFVFVTDEKNKKIFSSLDIVQLETKWKIAALKGSSYETIAKELFPHHEIILLSSYEDYENSEANAILWEEQQAIAWSVGKRNLRVIFPQPIIGIDSLSYAIKSNNPRFMNYLNQWLALKETEGFTKNQYDLWILGKTEIAAPYEPRWSIIRDVLHWSE